MSQCIFAHGGLPEDFEGIPISPDFRNMAQFEICLNDPEMEQEERIICGLDLLYPNVGVDFEQALRGLVWFYSRGESPDKKSGKKESSKRGYDLEQDSGPIYAAFLEVYGINLVDTDFLHWWEFLALLEALPDDTLIKKIIYWRMVSLQDLPKSERKFVEKMRKLYTLKKAGADQSLEDIVANRKAYVERRYAEAQAQLDAKGG